MSTERSGLRNLLHRARGRFGHPLATSSAQLAGSTYLAAGMRIVTVTLTARILGPAEYGEVALALALPSLVFSLVSVKSVGITTRYFSTFRAEGKHREILGLGKLGFLIDLGLAMVGLILVASVGWWVANYVYSSKELYSPMVGYAAFFPLFSLSETSSAVLASWRRFRLISAFSIAEQLVNLIGVLVVLSLGLGAAGVVMAMAASRGAVALLMLMSSTQLLRNEGSGIWWRGHLDEIGVLSREILSGVGWNYVATTMTGLIANVPVMLLGRLGGPRDAGFYRLATSIVTTASYAQNAAGRVTYPELAVRWGSTSRRQMRRTLWGWSRKAGVPVALLLLVCVPALRPAIPLLLGAEYSMMVAGTQLMLIGAVAGALFFWLSPYYYASGQIREWTKATAGHAAFTLLAGWLGARTAGFYGMAWASLLGRIVFTGALAVRGLSMLGHEEREGHSLSE